MMIKCLRALPLPMAAEHGTDADIFMAAPGELLSIPVHACREQNNPNCQCRRVFVGLATGNPTTLAQVCLCSSEEIEHECDSSSDVVWATDEEVGDDSILLHDPQGIAYAIRQLSVGSIVRVDRSEDAIVLQDTWNLAIQQAWQVWA